ncbi:MAG: hypothetical protein Q7J78_04430, partial [Clostridiales bacterium]|nr:hypothetical protein [Clostridiales bacterium]
MKKAKAACYSVFPKVVQAESTVRIRIKPLQKNCRFSTERRYEVIHIPMEYIGAPCSSPGVLNIQLVDGTLQVTCLFREEQEHQLVLQEINGDERKDIGSFHIYSVERDLFERRPYKGDLHMHSFHSDGKESPANITASCRKIGLDFMAVTDHGKYMPSIEAQEAFQSVETGLLIFRGEEVHPPENPVHMINFGGSFSVNELFHTDTYHEDLIKMDEESEEMPSNINRYQYNSCVWCFNKIREGGGLGIFCHPHWVCRNYYAVYSRLVS